jgi:uncharacterized ion transporter superfamily protein YfcC
MAMCFWKRIKRQPSGNLYFEEDEETITYLTTSEQQEAASQLTWRRRSEGTGS